MKTLLTSIAAGSLLTAIAIAQPAPRYRIDDLGTLAGTYSYAYGINSFGQVSGGAATQAQTDGVAQTAFLWYAGRMVNLGSLGGPQCPNCSSEAGGPNTSGASAVVSETSKRDPNGEDFCAFGTHRQCVAAVWKDGVMTALQNLGGKNGQAVGVSGLCSNTSVPPVNPFSLEPHAVLWDVDGSPINLGSLGGTFNVPGAINNRGDVAGAAQSSKDGNIHAFLWTKSAGMQDLGLFPGSVVTAVPCCNTINNSGQIALISSDAMGNTRALLWQNGKMYDLNDLIPAGSPWYLQFTASINDAGEIVGQGLINGEVHAFLASPR